MYELKDKYDLVIVVFKNKDINTHNSTVTV